MISRRSLLCSGLATAFAGLAPLPASVLPGPAAGNVPAEPPARDQALALRAQARRWLLERQQADGAFLAAHPFALGVSQLALIALGSGPDRLGPGHPAVARGLAYMERMRSPGGGWSLPGAGLGLYTTALGLQVRALYDLPADRDAMALVIAQQQVHQGDPADGGFSAAPAESGQLHATPDLHASHAALAGLVAAGVPADHPALQRAKRFLYACQNTSDGPGDRGWASGDGGGLYSPDPHRAGGHDDPTLGEGPHRPASTGSMSYSLLAGFALVGMDAQHPRVAALAAWLRSTYGFAGHPGMAPGRRHHGLFGYWNAAARALHLVGANAFRDDSGAVHDWRSDLVAAATDHAQLISTRAGAGVFWANSAPRWGETIPELATSYVAHALALAAEG